MIRRVRKWRNISRTAFATKLGISPATLDRIEQDQPQVDVNTVAQAARELGLSLHYGTRTIDDLPDLPPAAPPRRGMAGKKIIAVAPDVYAGLKLRAGDRTIEQYLTDLVRAKPSLNLGVIEAIPEAQPEAAAVRGLHKPPARRKSRRSKRQEVP